MKKEIYILIGPAGIGKTTFLKSIDFFQDKLSLISRDDIVGEISLRYGMSYDDLYHFPPHDIQPGTYVAGFEHFGKAIPSPEIVAHLHPYSYQYLNEINAEINYRFYNEFNAAIRNPVLDFIAVDRVHMRSYERKIYFEYLDNNRQNYVITAVLFNFKDADTLDIIEKTAELRRQKMSETGRYRTVTRRVQENMIKFYEEPTKEEGFDSIITVDTLPQLRNFLSSQEVKLGN